MTTAPVLARFSNSALNLSWPHGFHVASWKYCATPIGIPTDRPDNILWRIEEKAPHHNGRNWIMETRQDGRGIYHTKRIIPNDPPTRTVSGFVNIYPFMDGNYSVGHGFWPDEEKAQKEAFAIHPSGHITVPISFRVPA